MRERSGISSTVSSGIASIWLITFALLYFSSALGFLIKGVEVFASCTRGIQTVKYGCFYQVYVKKV